MYARRLVLVAMMCAVCTPAGLASAASSRGVPSAKAIALTRADLPAHASFIKTMSGYVPPRKLNGDTVPSGLALRVLRAAGFRGLYTQALFRPHDDNPYGYPWAYVALPTGRAAHRVYRNWVAGTVRPFNTPIGASRAANECALYRSVISTHLIGLLCRVGPYVVFGHYVSRAGVEGLMRRVVRRARHVRP